MSDSSVEAEGRLSVVNPSDSDEGDIDAPSPTPRWWLWIGSAILGLAVVLQKPGQIVYLTRLDRVMDPLRLAARSLTLWNPYWDMGSVQYQTVGYWLPFDATFIAGTLLHLPTWLTERIFSGGMLVIAFWGLVRLLDALGIGRGIVRIIGGLSYACCAVILGRAGQKTVLAMGAVFLPWSLLPLVKATVIGSTRRAAARSGVAIALMGGANAAVTLAVLPIPLLYLLTRQRGPRRGSLIRWWLLSAFVAIFWWMIGLYFFAKYGPNILRYTETVVTTTRTTSLFDVLRGSADWLSHMAVRGVTLPAGNTINTRLVPIIAISILCALGLAGLSRKQMPERRFIVLVLLLGVMAVGGGYASAFGNPFYETYRDLLSGLLGAFRNVYKFAPLVALPLALGLTHALDGIVEWVKRTNIRLLPSLAIGGVFLVIVGSAYPLLNDTFLKGPGFTEVPPAWVDAGKWLEANADGRVAVVPGLPEADYDWGFLQQLPIQWGSNISWATRNQGPVGGPEAIAYLEAVERAIDRGGDTGLVGFLRRAGFSTVVVPSDYRAEKYGRAGPESVNTALKRSGLEPAASFGDLGYGFGSLHQIEVYSIPGSARATTYSVASAAWLSGDIESVLRAPQSVFGDRAYLLADQKLTGGIHPSSWLVTDGNASNGIDFGLNHSNRTYMLGPNETSVGGVPISRRRLFDRTPESQTVQVLRGVEKLTASSVGPGIFVTAKPSRQPANIFDSNSETFWAPNRVAAGTSNDWGRGDNWIDILFDGEREVDGSAISLYLGVFRDPDIPVRVTTTSDNGSITTLLDPVETNQPLPVVSGLTHRLKISIEHESYRDGRDVIGIRDLFLPGEAVISSLVMPRELVDSFAQPGTATPSWLINRNRNDGIESDGVFRRQITVPKAAITEVLATASVKSQSDTLSFVDVTPTMSIASSTTLFNSAALAPRNLIDNDPSTEWVSARSTSDSPEYEIVTLQWNGDRLLSKIQVTQRHGAAVPSEIALTVGDQIRTASFDVNGSADFAPVSGTNASIVLTYPASESVEHVQQIALTSMTVDGITDLYPGPVDRDQVLQFDCETAPSVTVGSSKVRFTASPTLGEVIDGKSFALSACDSASIALPSGRVAVDSQVNAASLAIDRLIFGAPPLIGTPVVPGRALSIDTWGEASRKVTIGSGEEDILVVNEIHNIGWTASLGGQKLEPLIVDGWRQAFAVPAGSGGQIALTFAPNSPSLLVTIIALVLLAGLFIVAIVRSTKGAELPPAKVGLWPQWLVWGFAVIATLWATGVGVIFVPVVWLLLHTRSKWTPWFAGVSFMTAAAMFIVTKRWQDTNWFGWNGWLIAIFSALALSGVVIAFVGGAPSLDGSEDGLDG